MHESRGYESNWATSEGPNERDGHATVVDRTSGQVYLFGGFDGENAERNGLWMLEIPA